MKLSCSEEMLGEKIEGFDQASIVVDKIIRHMIIGITATRTYQVI